MKFKKSFHHKKGLVDPDSGTQDWNAACAKMSAGQVNLFWYSWQPQIDAKNAIK